MVLTFGVSLAACGGGATSLPDASSHPDSSTHVDAAGSSIDAPPSMIDAAPVVIDAAPVVIDAAPVVIDAAPPVIDAAPVMADATASPICGNGVVDPGEQCDDGNTVAGDCCSPACTVEAGCEIEVNDTFPQANDFAALSIGNVIHGHHSSDTDVDEFSVTIPPGVTGTLVAQTEDWGGQLCAMNQIDSLITIYDATGATIAMNDDFGGNWCSFATAPSLTAGQYYVEVKASTFAAAGTTFPYALSITLDICGDGIVGASESCDDGNTTPGDGCSATCQLEPVLETEPNDTCPTANGPYAVTTPKMYGGSITPMGEQDWYAFTLTSYEDVKFQTFASSGVGSCDAAEDTVITLFASDCTTQLATNDEGGIPHCSLLDPETSGGSGARHLAPGTYYLQVTPYPGASTFDYSLLVTPVSICGNGTVDGSEQCDGTPGCGTDCLVIPVCGDGFLSAGEWCDDGNTVAGDGCTSCVIDGTTPEIEPNDSEATATPQIAGTTSFVGAISPIGDHDYFTFTLAAAATVTLATHDISSPATCSFDSYIYLEDSTFALVASNDDTATNTCSLLSGLALPAGTYYVWVQRYADGATILPGYQLDLTIM
jgi:cysteine-rich repeat protein